MADKNMQTVEWHGVRMEVPAEWEIARHTVSAARGQLVFIDRRHQRLQFHWTRCDVEPDAALLLDGSRARDSEREGAQSFTELTGVGAWRGYRWIHGANESTRVGRFLRNVSCWLEVVFSWPEGRDEQLEQSILLSIRGSNSGERQRWRAFGIDVTVPRMWKLCAAEVLPADVALRFSNGSDKASVRKRKLAKVWFHSDIDELLRRELAVTVDLQSQRYGVHDGKQAIVRARWFTRLSGTARNRQAGMWLCPVSDAVYQIETDAAKRSNVNCDDMTVRCCGRGAS